MRTLGVDLVGWGLALGVTLATAGVIHAGEGTLDPSFDFDGRLTLDVVSGQNDLAWGVAIQPDGKIVVVGSTCDFNVCPTTAEDLLIARFLPDGSLDPGFGSAGVSIVALNWGGGNQEFVETSPLILATGEIVIATTVSVASGTHPVLVRLLPSGVVDPNFGPGGTAILDTIDGNGRALARQTDGKLLIAGDGRADNGTTDVFVARFSAAGALDTTFATSGVYAVDLNLGGDPGQFYEYGLGLALDPLNRVLVVGNAQSSPTNADGFILRLTPSGADDASFGVGGLVWLGFDLGGELFDGFDAVITDGQSRVIAAGRARTGPQAMESTVVRVDASGNLDATFGNEGLVRLDLDQGGEVVESLWSLGLDAVGRLVATGDGTGLDLNTRCHTVRLLENGTLDASFGQQGIVTVDFDLSAPPNVVDQCFAQAIQADGSIVLAGGATRSTASGFEWELIMARLAMGTAVFCDGFESGDTSRW